MNQVIGSVKTYLPQVKHFQDGRKLREFKMILKPRRVLDVFKDCLLEKFLIDNPTIYFSPTVNQLESFDRYYQKLNPKMRLDSWVYFDWEQTLIHSLSQEHYYNLRTVRNRDLVTFANQQKLYSKTIAVAGLSVGLNILTALVRYGIGNYYKLADPDQVCLSNFNRALYSVGDIGSFKLDAARKAIHGIDPFLKIKAYTKGLQEQSLNDFLAEVSLVIDAFDDFKLKLKLREVARKKKIPVITGFDVEKGVLLIVERFDVEPDLDFNFFLNNVDPAFILSNKYSVNDKTKKFISIIGKQYHSQQMLDSVLRVGSTLTGYPQLIIATMFAAGLFTLAAENIILGKSHSSFRKFISLSELMP